MTNRELNGYKKYPLCDTHVHLMYQDSLSKTLQVYRDIMEYFEYERIVLLGLHHDLREDDPANNAKVLYCKAVLNESNSKSKVYAFGSTLHYFDERDTAEGYLRQIEQLDVMGFDGVKLLDGKPELHKKIGRPLDDSIYDLFYAYAEKQGIPIKMHLGDPDYFWDLDKVSEYYDEKNYAALPDVDRPVFWKLKGLVHCYDESHATLSELRNQIEGILVKFPKLKLHLAHFYFLGNMLEESIRVLEKWENVAFDLTPGGSMFVGFSKRPEAWRSFFQKYADRIYYGTDTYNTLYFEDKEDYETAVVTGVRSNQVRRMLEWERPFEDDFFGKLIPLHLDDNSLRKIYHDNCVSLLGKPKEPNKKLAALYTSQMTTMLEHGFLHTESQERDKEEIENLRQIYSYFQNE